MKHLTLDGLRQTVKDLEEEDGSLPITIWNNGERLFLYNQIDTSIDGQLEFNSLHKYVNLYVKENVEVHIRGIFEDVHLEFDTKFGDISPEQDIRLAEAKRILCEVITEYVEQNK